MKTLIATLCIAGSVFALSACETGTSYDSGANFATGRTAGELDTTAAARPAPARAERVFREVQTK